jgi:hypothetical protein
MEELGGEMSGFFIRSVSPVRNATDVRDAPSDAWLGFRVKIILAQQGTRTNNERMHMQFCRNAREYSVLAMQNT